MNRRTLVAGAVAALVFAGVLFATRRPKRTPEDEVRALVAKAVAGAEARDVGAIADVMAEGFTGPGGMNRAEVKQLLLGQFFRGPRGVVVLNPRLDVTVTSKDHATFSGTFVLAQDRGSADGALGRWEIDGVVDRDTGDWLITSAIWRQP